MSEHTPWVARLSGDSDDLWTVEDSSGGVVFFGMDEDVARLFAAAPDMLAALKAVVEDGAFPDFLTALKMARAAIARAEDSHV